MTVATHQAWGVDLSALRSAGIDVSVEQDFSDVLPSLTEPQYGETIMGELLDTERAMFAELKRATDQLETLGREYAARSLERFGGQIRHSDVSKPLHETIKPEDLTLIFDNDEERLLFFRLERKVAMLHANLYWSIGERFKAHDWSVGVRSKWRAVKVKLKSGN